MMTATEEQASQRKHAHPGRLQIKTEKVLPTFFAAGTVTVVVVTDDGMCGDRRYRRLQAAKYVILFKISLLHRYRIPPGGDR